MNRQRSTLSYAQQCKRNGSETPARIVRQRACNFFGRFSSCTPLISEVALDMRLIPILFFYSSRICSDNDRLMAPAIEWKCRKNRNIVAEQMARLSPLRTIAVTGRLSVWGLSTQKKPSRCKLFMAFGTTRYNQSLSMTYFFMTIPSIRLFQIISEMAVSIVSYFSIGHGHMKVYFTP